MPHTRRHRQSPADERGQTLTEYSLLVGLIAIVVAVALPAIGGSLAGFFQTMAEAL